ncbi:MAG: alpha/beta fold hydrolase [Vulcanimicrobiaceae bacterium]
MPAICRTPEVCAEDFDVAVTVGRVRAHRFGPPDGRLVICVPGMSANSRWFDYLAERLVARDRQVVALDLRGRGRSSVTPRGTYGLLNHARDVFAVARQLGAASFDFIGHSMGAYVGMEAGALRNEVRLRRLVLIDGLGVPRLSALLSIGRVLERLDRSYTSPEAYLAYVRSLGLARWNAYWQRIYEYEVLEEGGRVRSRARRAPIFEDIAYGRTHDARRLWRKLDLPVLALRATRPLAGRTGFVVPPCDLRNFVRIAPRATVAEVDDNHYEIVMHPHTVATIRGFLDAAA